MTKKLHIKRFIALVGGVSFLGSTALGISTVFREALTQPATMETRETAATTQQQQLAAQERGYETVLQREPQNQIALEGLANVRLQMNNPKGAVEPLELLVKLYPERSDYQAILAQVKQQIGEASTEPQP